MNSTASLRAQLTHLNKENERLTNRNSELNESLNNLTQQKDVEINRLNAALGQATEERDKISQQCNVQIAHKEQIWEMLRNLKGEMDDHKKYEIKSIVRRINLGRFKLSCSRRPFYF